MGARHLRTVGGRSYGVAVTEGSSSLGVLWGKSASRGGASLLVQHLLDTAAVGEIVWSSFLPSAVTGPWDEVTDGHGRQVFAALCGLHDIGKASPAFQSKDPDLSRAVQLAGLTWGRLGSHGRGWHHTLAGARVLVDHLVEQGWSKESTGWLWPFIEGHHGRLTASGCPEVNRSVAEAHGTGEGWQRAQRDLLTTVAWHLDLPWGALRIEALPGVADQGVLLGALIMCDWIASNSEVFEPVMDLEAVSMGQARGRARQGFAVLGLRGGWDPSLLSGGSGLIERRFGRSARPSQQAVLEAAEGMAAPGLLIVEAPMGEGKTEAALGAAEVLSRRFGADGVFVGMPTRATSDPMFVRVRDWAAEIDPDVPLALLHGKARFNREWKKLQDQGRVRIEDVDEYGMDDRYGSSPVASAGPSQAPVEWFLGRKRGMLSPIVVGTVDHLLYAATRTTHVMLRHTGLAGKVIVLDEVHAYDTYMSQFLHEALRLLAQLRVPVVLLSATLPPRQREQLARSYVQGATLTRDIEVPISAVGYPQVTSVAVVDGAPSVSIVEATAYRPSVPVAVEVLPEPTDAFDPEPVAQRIAQEIVDGGCVMVIRNTVARAQQTYLSLRRLLDCEVVLLHSRLTAQSRADRTDRVLELLGPEAAGRPTSLVVVATQLAEQSFDVDADLLVSDLAPMDLLLQRCGRLHRHDRTEPRPPRMATPRVVVTGFDVGQLSQAPTFPAGSVKVYHRLPLLAAAAAVQHAVEAGWSLPADVPRLVEAAYDDRPVSPPGWAADVDAAVDDLRAHQQNEAARAENFLLLGEDQLGGQETLRGLHRAANGAICDDEDTVQAVVRGGDKSVEVVLVVSDGARFRTLAGAPLGPNGELPADPGAAEQLVGSAIRLPPHLTSAAMELRPLPGWVGDPWLARTPALVLDTGGSCELGPYFLRYDDDLGLLVRHGGAPA